MTMGQLMFVGGAVLLVLAIVPIVAFYLAGQKYIVSGVMAGAIKE